MKQRRVDARLLWIGVVAVAIGACGSSNGPDGERQSGGSGGAEDPAQTSVGGNVALSSTSAGAVTNTGGAGTTTSSATIDKVTPKPVTCRKTGDGKTTLVLVNGCASKLSVRGSNGVTGELIPGEHLCVDLGTDVEPLNSLRYWGFIGEDPGGEHHTLAEMTLNTDFNDFDWYNLSHVDAHNLPLSIVPIDKKDCRSLTCGESLLANCPAEGIYRDSKGVVVACVSPLRDNANSPVAQYFDASCKDAYSWSGDDQDSMVACAGEDYDVVFCP
jgi:Thaumatin family